MPGNEEIKGLRRVLTREMFEELAALQCTPEEILGYTGLKEKSLKAWCRRVYRRPLPEMMEMIRQDGLIAIRRASFEQLKKSATIVSQQYNRFLPAAAADPGAGAEAAVRALTASLSPGEDELHALYRDPDGDPE